MPKLASTSNLNTFQTSGAPLQIAQAVTTPVGTAVDASGAAAHTAQQESSRPGSIPDPKLLFNYSLLIIAILIILAAISRRNLQKTPKGIQNLAEQIVESLDHFTRDIIGPGGEKYTPLVGTIFIYIFLMNLIGIVPGLHSPTANITITLALGVCVFFYVQYEGIRTQGLIAQLKHFTGPPLEGPLALIKILLTPIEIISEIIKPFTLAIRLFGNIFGEDVIVLVLAGLGGVLISNAFGWLPFQIPVLFLMLLTDGVQALVFAILTCIYISLVTGHKGEEHVEESEAVTAHSPSAAH